MSLIATIDGVDAAGDLDAEAQQRGDREHEQRGDEVVVRAVDPRRQVDPERVLADDAEVVRPARRDGRRAERELEDEVPADDPRDELAEARVGERVRRAGDRHRRGELGVAQRGERAGDAGGDERQRDRRAGERAGGLAGQHEDAGADDDADAEDDEIQRAERAAQAVVARPSCPRSTGRWTSSAAVSLPAWRGPSTHSMRSLASSERRAARPCQSCRPPERSISTARSARRHACLRAASPRRPIRRTRAGGGGERLEGRARLAGQRGVELGRYVDLGGHDPNATPRPGLSVVRVDEQPAGVAAHVRRAAAEELEAVLDAEQGVLVGVGRSSSGRG